MTAAELVIARRLPCGAYLLVWRSSLGHAWSVTHRDGTTLRSREGEYWLVDEDARAYAEALAEVPPILAKPARGRSRWEARS
ncbi:MAG: hypothetical protein KIS66_13625 [Fimbriimonadaceae bacterium]|nr:hypothetical protein [Fimbriimonadaceae bacterium]